MGVLKWCKNNSKLLYFPGLFHVSFVIILLFTAGMVKNQFESFFEAVWLSSSLFKLVKLNPQPFYSPSTFVLCSWKKRVCEMVMKLEAKHPGARVDDRILHVTPRSQAEAAHLDSYLFSCLFG